MWAYVDLAPLARQLPEYRSWNHDGIQLNEDADARSQDMAPEDPIDSPGRGWKRKRKGKGKGNGKLALNIKVEKNM